MAVQQLNEQELVRRQTLDKIRQMGIDPYPPQEVEITHSTDEIKKNFTDEEKDKWADVKLAGRLMSKRIIGKASFAEIQDQSGRIQAYFNRDEICPGEDKALYNDLFKKLTDRGDYIAIEGHVFRTQVGEISIHVKKFALISKSIKPLPIPKTDDRSGKCI